MAEGAKRTAGDTVTLVDHRTGRSFDLHLRAGSLGPSVIDIQNLYRESGYFTFDPGFTSTGSCESSITFIDGEKGVLLHRGYPIEELAADGDYLEVCYLLLHGELPSAAAICLTVSPASTIDTSSLLCTSEH